MRKTATIALACFLCTASPASAQSFLNKAIKTVEKTVDTADKLLKGKSNKAKKTSADTKDRKTDTQQAQTGSQFDSSDARRKTDLAKANLKGQVKATIELQLWSGVESRSTYTYNPKGMLEEYTSEDGVVRCKYDAGILLAHREVELAKRDYAVINWDGEQYMEYDGRGFEYDSNGRLIREGTPYETITYTYLKGGNVVRANIDRERSNAITLLYLYDVRGNLLQVYWDEVAERNLRQEFRYDSQGRKVYEKHPSGVVYEYKYNDKDDVKYRKTTETYGHDEDSEDTFDYRYDEYGNWIEKTWKSNGKVVCTYTRTIMYYE